MNPVPDPLLLRKSGSAENRTWDFYLHNSEENDLETSHKKLKVVIFKGIK
jgi:hypothetical protein